MRPNKLIIFVVFILFTLTPLISISSTLQEQRTFDRLWANYIPQLQEHFLERLTLEESTLRKLASSGARIKLLIHLNKKRRVIAAEILEPSTIEEFDRACLKAANLMGRLPSLPPEIADRGRKVGLEFVFATRSKSE